MRTLKTCNRCGSTKPVEEFALRMSVKKGLVPRTFCKACDVEQVLTPEQKRRKQLMTRYGLTLEAFTALGDEQEWLCRICQDSVKEEPHVDHDHSTGEVRGLLCLHCNVGLGHFHDSPELLQAAINYLRNYSREEYVPPESAETTLPVVSD